MSTQQRRGPGSREWIGFALILIVSHGGQALASAHHRRSKPARHPSLRPVARPSSHNGLARAAKASAAHRVVSVVNRPRWHPGVDLALKLSGQRVPHR
jgi:hypothetical protein